MERPAPGATPEAPPVLLIGAVGVIAVTMVAHSCWWWLERYDWGADLRSTHQDIRDGLADPWFWSVEVVCAGIVVAVAAATMVWGVRHRPVVAVQVGAAALVALAQMASLRVLMPSRAESQLSEEAGVVSPEVETGVVDGALLRSVGLAALMVVLAVAMAARGRERPAP